VMTRATVDGALPCAVGDTDCHAVAWLCDLGAALDASSVCAALLAIAGVALSLVFSTAASITAVGTAVFSNLQIVRVRPQLLLHSVTFAVHLPFQCTPTAC